MPYVPLARKEALDRDLWPASAVKLDEKTWQRTQPIRGCP
jgi:hypothetical protein